MKFFEIVLLGYLFIQAARSKSIISDELAAEWKSYKVEYNKSYSEAEDQIRFKIFLDTKESVNEHNKRFENGEISFTVELNHFADYTKEEHASLSCLHNSPVNLSSIPAANYYVHQSNVYIPKSKDWRTEGAVTHVKNQGWCGSCWAFSATGSLEGQHFLKTRKLVSLSEQNLMDCSDKFGNNGCRGGSESESFEYIRDNGGVDTEQSYPYIAHREKCRYNYNKKGASCKGYKMLKAGEEELMKAIATIGPISVHVHATNLFKKYKAHIYDDPQCDGTVLNHSVLAVGYGTDERGKDYWILKNSWGAGWGMDGCMDIKLARNKRMCGIGSSSTFPLV